MPDPRMPTLYLPHGGGPWPFVELGIFESSEEAALEEFLRNYVATLPEPPCSVLVVSAHWEEALPTVMAAQRPPMLYDYYGFPQAAYSIQWPAPGDPELADRIRRRLDAAGFDSAENSERGYDHGTFIPLKLMFPDAKVPTVQLSLAKGLDPATHIALGRAIEPFRDEGVLIIGSGMSFHDLPSFFDRRGREVSESFDAWLRDAATRAPKARRSELEAWERAPSARQAHPREEHLLPLMVVAGAAGEDPGRVAFNGLFGNARISAIEYATPE